MAKTKKLLEIKAKLEELEFNPDSEFSHEQADELLCQALEHLGHKDIVEIYRKIQRWFA